MFYTCFTCVIHVDISPVDSFHSYVDLIYSSWLEINNTIESSKSASYLNIVFYRNIYDKLTHQIYVNQEDFFFSILNFPYFM